MALSTNPAVTRAIRLTFGFQFFFGLLPWVPVFSAYQKQLGMSDAEIFGIQSIYYIAFCLPEIRRAWSPAASTTGHHRSAARAS